MEGELCPQVHLPRGLPTASWAEANGTHQAGPGLETESAQPRLVIPSVCPSYSVQTVLGQALWGLGHQWLSTPQTIIHTCCTPGPGLDLNLCEKDRDQLS